MHCTRIKQNLGVNINLCDRIKANPSAIHMNKDLFKLHISAVFRLVRLQWGAKVQSSFGCSEIHSSDYKGFSQ